MCSLCPDLNNTKTNRLVSRAYSHLNNVDQRHLDYDIDFGEQITAISSSTGNLLVSEFTKRFSKRE